MAQHSHRSPGSAAAVTSQGRRVVPALVLSAAALGIGVLAVLTAGGDASLETTGRDLVGAEADGLAMVYRGAEISPGQLQDLNDDGKAMVGVHNSELACQGITLYFDTATEADAYGREYLSREKKRAKTGAAAAGADPCSSYEDAPHFLRSSR